MMTQKEMMMYDEIVEMEIATPEELNLARCLVSGDWEDALNAVVYVRTGCHTFEDFILEEMDDYD
jgi:hypothetical protein